MKKSLPSLKHNLVLPSRNQKYIVLEILQFRIQNISSGHRILKLDYYHLQIFQSCPATFLKRQGIIIQKKGDFNPKKVVKAQGEEKPWKGTLFIVQICTLCQKLNWGTNQVFFIKTKYGRTCNCWTMVYYSIKSHGQLRHQKNLFNKFVK